MHKILALILVSATPVFSALAPLPQSVREIEAILINPNLADHLPATAEIDQITRVCDGYLVITKAHTLKVTVIYDKTPRIGPRKFTLHFGEPQRLKGPK